MITKAHFSNFRGFDVLDVGPLKRLTLFAGQNNTGKTSILEGIYLGAIPAFPRQDDLPVLFRSQPGAFGGGRMRNPHQRNPVDDFESFWSWLFRNHDSSKAATIKLFNEQNLGWGVEFYSDGGSPQQNAILFTRLKQTLGQEQARAGGPFLTVQKNNQPNFNAAMDFPPQLNIEVLSTQPSNPTELADLYNLATQFRDAESKIEDLMRKLEPRIRRIRYSRSAGTSHSIVTCDVGMDRAVPLTQMGEGFNRALAIFCQILVSSLDVLLVDEIENGLHHSVLPAVWRGLFEVAETENVQFIATTHSWECVRAAYEVAKNRTQDEFQYLRLDRVDGAVKCTAVDQNALEEAIKHGWEMR